MLPDWAYIEEELASIVADAEFMGDGCYYKYEVTYV